ncbi:MAG: 1-acyl-sn-glycerol-3-phosphate acyltransferase [Verrucomicrobiales bacterium]|nr:1-acyl-sn-glycerol-3-phosphate acyltransferase [Verrucomicrobiales bacterium]
MNTNTPRTFPVERASMFYRSCAVVVRSFGAAYLNWSVYHPERVPITGPLILAANHVSYGDPPLIGGAVPRPIQYLARESLFRIPIFSPLIRTLNAVPIDRDGVSPAGLRTVLDLLNDGRAVLLFPEGTRSPDGNIQGAKTGVGLAVIKSGAPVVPVRVFGLYDLWGRRQILPRPGHMAIKFGMPLRFDRQREEMETASRVRSKAIYDEVTREIMDSIRRLEPCRDVTRFG